MPTYVAMLNWTAQGLKDIKESPNQLNAVRKRFEEFGVKMKDFYMVTGRYDMITVLEAPDDAALARAILTAAAQGRITSETCRAFTEEEYRKILS